MPLVAHHDAQARIEKRQLAQAAFENREIILDLGEGAAARLERHFRALRLVRRTHHNQWRHRIAMLETDEMFQPAAPDAHFHPFGQRVHHRGAHAVQAAGNLVGVLVELAAGMQPRQHDFGCRHALFGMHVGGDAAAVVAHRHRAVAVQHHGAGGGETGLRLVDGVVDDLERHVMQAGAVIGVADVHAGALAHRVEALAHRDRRGLVVLRDGVSVGRRRSGVGHAEV